MTATLTGLFRGTGANSGEGTCENTARTHRVGHPTQPAQPPPCHATQASQTKSHADSQRQKKITNKQHHKNIII